MRYFSYNTYKTDPSVDPCVETVSEDDIRREYWPSWSKRMIEKYGEECFWNSYGFDHCLLDFCVVHWAWEVEAPECPVCSDDAGMTCGTDCEVKHDKTNT